MQFGTGTVDPVSGSPRNSIHQDPWETNMKKFFFLLAIIGAAAAAAAAFRRDDVKTGAKKATNTNTN